MRPSAHAMTIFSVAIYGVFAAEAFDPHFYYGKTLIELAKMEDSVFSTALHGLAPSNEDVSGDEKDDDIGDMEALSGFFIKYGTHIYL